MILPWSYRWAKHRVFVLCNQRRSHAGGWEWSQPYAPPSQQCSDPIWQRWVAHLCAQPIWHAAVTFPKQNKLKKNATVAANCLAHAWLLERVFKHAVSCWRELQRFLTAAPLVSKISLTARILFFQRGSLNLILFIYTPSLLLSSSTGRVWVGNNYFCLLMFIASE